MVDDMDPEHRLITLCREIIEDGGDVVSINFRVNREFGEYQTYSIGRKDETEKLES